MSFFKTLHFDFVLAEDVVLLAIKCGVPNPYPGLDLMCNSKPTGEFFYHTTKNDAALASGVGDDDEDDEDEGDDVELAVDDDGEEVDVPPVADTDIIFQVDGLEFAQILAYVTYLHTAAAAVDVGMSSPHAVLL